MTGLSHVCPWRFEAQLSSGLFSWKFPCRFFLAPGFVLLFLPLSCLSVSLLTRAKLKRKCHKTGAWGETILCRYCNNNLLICAVCSWSVSSSSAIRDVRTLWWASFSEGHGWVWSGKRRDKPLCAFIRALWLYCNKSLKLMKPGKSKLVDKFKC